MDCFPGSSSGEREVQGNRSWVAFSDTSMVGLISYFESNRRSINESPHIRSMSTVRPQYNNNGVSELGFFLDEPENCKWGYLNNDSFVEIDQNIARASDLNNNVTCGFFKLILGAMQAQYFDTCQKIIRLSTVNGIRQFSADDRASVVTNVNPDFDQNYLVAWESAANTPTATTSYSTFLEDILTGNVEEGFEPAANTELSVVASTIVVDGRSGQASISLASQSIDEPSSFVGIESELGAYEALKQGQAVSSVDLLDGSLAARWVPVAPVTTSQRLSMDGTITSVKEQPYLLLVESKSGDPLVTSFDAAELVRATLDAESFSIELTQPELDPFPLPDIPGLDWITGNPIRDEFMLRHGLSLDDIPAEIIIPFIDDLE